LGAPSFVDPRLQTVRPTPSVKLFAAFVRRADEGTLSLLLITALRKRAEFLIEHGLVKVEDGWIKTPETFSQRCASAKWTRSPKQSRKRLRE
jgi:hypothetical protein